jgi:sporulation protein YpjB
MKARILIVTIVLFIAAPTLAAATDHNHWDRLDKIADQALQMAKQGEFEKADTMLNYFKGEFPEAEGENVSSENIRIVKITLEDAANTLNSSNIDDKVKVHKVLQFRLAVDAVHSAYQPMWTEMENYVMSSFEEMKKTLLENELRKNENEVNQFLSKFNVIYPSLMIDLEPEQIDRLNSHLSFLEENYMEATATEQATYLNLMENDLMHIFNTLHMEETDPSLRWVMTSMSIFIFSALFYVGWRKYRGGRKTIQS